MTRGDKAVRWIENFCIYPHGFNKGQFVVLTTEQKEIVRAVFDTDNASEVTGPLAAYLALFHIAGPRDLAAHVSVLPLSADTFTTWNAVGPDLRAVVKRDGERIVCPELGTKFPPVAA
ncbi:MAG: hypothetical protein WBZ28_24115 [Pseudolabrys sp.]